MAFQASTVAHSKAAGSWIKTDGLSIPFGISIHRETSRSSPSVASLHAKRGDASCGLQSILQPDPPSSGDFATMELSYACRFSPPLTLLGTV